MSTPTLTTLIELADDPLGDIVLESEVTFGARAAALAGNPAGLTGNWWEMGTANITCSLTLTPPEPE